jgi:hypothetical protein
MIGFVPEADPETNQESMMLAMEDVKSGQVTYAVRDTSVDGKNIKIGDIMGIDDNGIQAVGTDIQGVTLDMIRSMVDEDAGLISIYYGQDTSAEDARALEQRLADLYPDLDVDVNFGGQPIYYYIVSVE